MAGPESPPVPSDQLPPSGRAAGLQGAAETVRESHPVDPSPLKLVDPPAPREGAMPLDHWLQQAVAQAGPADARRTTLHLNAMIAGAGQHPRLKWARGEMLTEQEFKDGIALVEGHRPELLHRAPARLILVPGEDER